MPLRSNDCDERQRYVAISASPSTCRPDECDCRFKPATLSQIQLGAETRFVTAFARVGFSGDFGGSYFLSKLIGTGKARELYFTSEPLDAQQALSLGIANRIVADAELDETTMHLAR